MEDKGQFDIILLDFAKAFDKVSHRRLLLKAKHYGVRGRTLQWVEDFLAGRTQQVILEGQLSHETRVTSGVPQGSVLGPLLFLKYINDLPDSINNSTSRLYADDCLMYKSIKSHQDCDKLQEDLDRLQVWENTWKMEFHPAKCQVLRVTNKRNPITGQYIHGHPLEEVGSAKYLGVHIDRKLNFNTHVDATVKKANSVCAFLRRNFKRCNRRIKQATYFTYVRPIVEYAATAWDPHTEKCQQDWDGSAKVWSARYVSGDYNQTSSVTAMLTKLQWSSFASRRLQNRLIMLYRICFDLVDIDWQQYLCKSTSSTRGHGTRFSLPNLVYQPSVLPILLSQNCQGLE